MTSFWTIIVINFMQEVNIKAEGEGLFEGTGQDTDTLEKQKKVLEEKANRSKVNKKIFEDLEKKAEDEMIRDSEKIKGKARVFGGAKSKKAKDYRQR